MKTAALVSAAVMAIAAGCGGDSKDESGTGIASKPAEQIVRESAEALRRARSVHLEGTLSIENRSTAVEIDFEQKNVRLAFKQKESAVSLIVVGTQSFIKANASFWKAQRAGRKATALAGQWLEVPTSEAELRDLTKSLSLETLSRCLETGPHGTLRVAGKRTVDGRPAVMVTDSGNRPGSAPSELFVSTTGDPVPLRATSTGRQRPGGKKDPDCNDPDSRARPGDQITFSRYNHDLNIEAPADARDLTPDPGTAS